MSGVGWVGGDGGFNECRVVHALREAFGRGKRRLESKLDRAKLASDGFFVSTHPNASGCLALLKKLSVNPLLEFKAAAHTGMI